MTQELQTRIVGLLRKHGYLVAAFQLELEPTDDETAAYASESQREAAAVADGKPDGQAANAKEHPTAGAAGGM